MNARHALLLLVLAAAPAAAQTPPASGEAMTIHPEAKAAIGGLWSPYCPGMMLAVCTSPGGAMLRDSAQSWASQGLSSDSIIGLFVAEYGEEYRAEPLAAGTGLMAWVIPPLILLAGLGAVATVLARRRRSTPFPAAAGAAAAGPAVPAEDEARLRAAMKQLDEEEEPVF
ncbi:MAG: cytochrome c-type biogenesis protein CcmH [Longimicrobiales bacterium]